MAGSPWPAKEHTMKVEFDETKFRFAHGKAPRGRGGWAFRFRVNGSWAVVDGAEDLGDLGECFFAPGQRTFAEAKRWARARASQLGADLVEVCS
jgi:hypothetical protein